MNRPSTSRDACEPDAKPDARQVPVHRHVRRGTNETIPWVVQHRIGRNDPCPCECGKKAKKCPRGLALIEAARWA